MHGKKNTAKQKGSVRTQKALIVLSGGGGEQAKLMKAGPFDHSAGLIEPSDQIDGGSGENQFTLNRWIFPQRHPVIEA